MIVPFTRFRVTRSPTLSLVISCYAVFSGGGAASLRAPASSVRAELSTTEFLLATPGPSRPQSLAELRPADANRFLMMIRVPE